VFLISADSNAARVLAGRIDRDRSQGIALYLSLRLQLFKPTVRAELSRFFSTLIVMMSLANSLGDDPFVSVEFLPSFQFSNRTSRTSFLMRQIHCYNFTRLKTTEDSIRKIGK